MPIPPDQFPYLQQVPHAEMRASTADRQKRIGSGGVRPGRRDLHFPPLAIEEDEHMASERLPLFQRLELQSS